MKANLTLLLLVALGTTTYAQNSLELIYKKIDSTELRMEVNYPPDYQPGQKYPTIVFFFGGGWVSAATYIFTKGNRRAFSITKTWIILRIRY